jgi:hypothetical protein
VFGLIKINLTWDESKTSYGCVWICSFLDSQRRDVRIFLDSPSRHFTIGFCTRIMIVQNAAFARRAAANIGDQTDPILEDVGQI